MAQQNRSRFPTAYDVARLAGTSQSAVSRAFTPGASISPQMRDKITAAAHELGYRPNIAARTLSNQKSKIVGVISGYMEHPFFARALERLAGRLSDAGLRILLFNAEQNGSADRLVEEMLSYQVRAVLLIGVGVSSNLAEECDRAGIPVILFNRTAAVPGAAIEVIGDNDAGAIAIAERFLELGRKRIAFMAGYAESGTSLVREAAFMDFFAQRGLPLPRRVVGNYTHEGATVAARALFADSAQRPDAVFCANDLMAIATIETLRIEFGLEPGRDYAIAGFDNIAMAAWPSFALTTYSQPMDGMVDEAARIITAGADARPIRSIVVKGEMILRNTA